MKISVAALRRILTPGTRFIAEFIGKNKKVAKPKNMRCERIVLSQSSTQMICQFGHDKDVKIYNTWKQVKVEKTRENEYELSIVLDDGSEDKYLRITL